MPTFTPGKPDRDALVALAKFIEAQRALDPWAAASVPATSALVEKLGAAISDIDDHMFSIDVVSLSLEEGAALVWYAGMFAERAEAAHAAVAGRMVRAVFGPELLQHVAARESGPNRLHLAPRRSRRAFVVYGRGRAAYLELRDWLKGCGLEVAAMEAEKAEGAKTLAEALEEQMAACGTAIVLATADDLGRLKGGQAQFAARARQNVILELGWMIGLLGRSRVVVLLQNALMADFPSDFAGVTTIRFEEDVRTAFDELRRKLQAMGVLTMQPA